MGPVSRLQLGKFRAATQKLGSIIKTIYQLVRSPPKSRVSLLRQGGRENPFRFYEGGGGGGGGCCECVLTALASRHVVWSHSGLLWMQNVGVEVSNARSV